MRIPSLILFCSVILLTPVFPFNAQTNGDSSRTANVDSLDFHLYVSNQSFALDTVDITVYIDDHLVLKRDFYVEIQHTWINFHYRLSNGQHTLRAVSIKGSSSVEKDFIFPKTCWAVVEFWYYPTLTGGAGPTPKQFSVDFMNTQPKFQ